MVAKLPDFLCALEAEAMLPPPGCSAFEDVTFKLFAFYELACMNACKVAAEATELEKVNARLKEAQEAIKESGFVIPVPVDGYL